MDTRTDDTTMTEDDPHHSHTRLGYDDGKMMLPADTYQEYVYIKIIMYTHNDTDHESAATLRRFTNTILITRALCLGVV